MEQDLSLATVLRYDLEGRGTMGRSNSVAGSRLATEC